VHELPRALLNCPLGGVDLAAYNAATQLGNGSKRQLIMTESLRGQFLIAAKHLRDSNFFKTVVLLLEHNQQGAMGLVINRPSSVPVSQVLAEHFELPETGEVVYMGGPVEPGSLFILHNTFAGGDSDCVSSPPPVEGVFVGCSKELFQSVVQAVSEGDEATRFRIFSGCAGWAPKQLESEIGRGDWLIAPASPEYVFHKDPYAVWDELMHSFRKAHPLIPAAIGNPEWN
jgi:putative transcriptional regulator